MTLGFVNAGDLYIEDKLLDSNGNILLVEDWQVENLDESVKVYNFQVEDFHTYFVGNCAVWVHNECNLPTENSRNFVKRKDHKDGSVTITKKLMEKY